MQKALKKLRKVTHILVDKTGTLSEGKPRVTTCIGQESEFISLAASLEQNSEHPLARAVMDYAKGKAVNIEVVHKFSIHHR